MWRNLKHPGSCHECRKRRLKCDEAKPYCFKCQKNGRSCSGYTDWTQLPVRDMTVSTINRFRASEPRHKSDEGHTRTLSSKRPQISGWMRGARRGMNGVEPDSSAIIIATNPTYSIDELAMSYLRAEFIEQHPLALDPGYAYLMRLILGLERMDNCLSACLSAAALAAFSSLPNAKNVEMKAQKAYASALSAMNTAIQRSSAAEDDQLLASVLLLAFYESFRSNKLVGFYNHIFGAASMIKARKTKAVLDGLTAQLYLVVRYELCRTSLLGFANPADADLGLWLRWRNGISGATYTPNALADVHKINESTLDYHVRSMMDFAVAKNPMMEMINQSGFPQDAESSQHFIQTAVTYIKSVVDRFTEMETTAFVTKGSRPLRLPRPVQRDFIFPDAYPDTPISVYKNMHHAIFHMCVCVARVSCLTHLMALVAYIKFPIDFQDMPAYRSMVQRAQDDLETIVSSVPYICGWTADGRHIFPGAAASGVDPHPQSLNTGLATNFMTWALIGPATHPLATQEQKNYLIHMTRYIAQVRRVRQADAMLDVTAQATTHKSMSQWHRTVLSGAQDQIPASWIGKGTSLEAEIYHQAES